MHKQAWVYLCACERVAASQGPDSSPTAPRRAGLRLGGLASCYLSARRCSVWEGAVTKRSVFRTLWGAVTQWGSEEIPAPPPPQASEQLVLTLLPLGVCLSGRPQGSGNPSFLLPGPLCKPSLLCDPVDALPGALGQGLCRSDGAAWPQVGPAFPECCVSPSGLAESVSAFLRRPGIHFGIVSINSLLWNLQNLRVHLNLEKQIL